MMNVALNSRNYSAKLNRKQPNQKTQTPKQQVAFSGVVAKTTGKALGAGISGAKLALGVTVFGSAMGLASSVPIIALIGGFIGSGLAVDVGLNLRKDVKTMEKAVENLSNKSPDLGKLAQKAMNGISRIIKK